MQIDMSGELYAKLIHPATDWWKTFGFLGPKVLNNLCVMGSSLPCSKV